MAVITITITESPIQLVSGIPRSITVETNVPATVFYTLDESDPTSSSDIAVGDILLPSYTTVTFKAFATDGVDSSPIVIYVFYSDISTLRRAHNTVYGSVSDYDINRAFSSPSPDPYSTYGNTAGITVDAPGVTGIPYGYDGTATGTAASETDEDYTLVNYDIIYNETNSRGEFIGQLPANVVLDVSTAPPLMSDANSSLFDPRALVIIQDGREENENEFPMINRQFFSMGDNSKIRNGIKYDTTGFEGNVATGSMMRPQYNEKEDTWTFYYRDSETNRWIISVEPNRQSRNVHAVRNVVFPNMKSGARKVFKWIPFKRSILR